MKTLILIIILSLSFLYTYTKMIIELYAGINNQVLGLLIMGCCFQGTVIIILIAIKEWQAFRQHRKIIN